ncbi:MAG: PQQ-like beta-propeller repeat protein [Armatimonadetes bacterium]|nr:PQQ-like beta-propeller repeat protein [Armatimonadota bacterium]
MKRFDSMIFVAIAAIAVMVGCGGNDTYSVKGGSGGSGGSGGGGSSAPWPKFKHDNQNTGRTAVAAGIAHKSFAITWEFVTGGGIANSAAIGTDGTIYFVSTDSNVYAVNGATGAEKWHFALDRGGNSSPLIGADGTIYVGGGPVLHALSPTSGAEIWHFDVQSGFGNNIIATPVLTASNVICLADDRGIAYGVDATTGTQIWTFTASSSIEGPMAVAADGTLYFSTGDDTTFNFYALDSATGAQKWIFNADDFMEGGVAIASDGTIYFGSRNKNLFAVNPNGTMKWTYALGGTRSTPAIGADGTVYAISDTNGSCVALNGATGAKIWETSIVQDAVGSPAIASDGSLFVGGDKLYQLNGATGAQISVFNPGTSFRDASPSIGVDGTIYAGGVNGHMYAVK